DVLAEFTPEQQAEIRQKQQTLSSLAYFIGKDFRIPVELNKPGAGWHWDFQENVIRIDPKDLLEKPMDYLRFVISHEGGHRRISRVDSIPLEEWKQPGFAFMMNAIEDPRDNNFVAESYPKFREQMGLAYTQDLDFEGKAKEKAAQKLGYQPRFMQAGFEYIKQWFKEAQGQEMQMSADLPDEVKAVVQATIEHARDSWWRYPSREEADKSEELIKKYAQVSYEINRDEIWPEFKKLIDADMEDQKMQELLKDAQKNQEGEESGGQGLPQELKDELTPEEQQALQEAIKQAIEDAKKEKDKAETQGDEPEGAEGKPEADSSEGTPSGKPVDISSLSEELKQKIKEYIESLPEDQQREIAEKAQAAFKEFEDALNEELQGKLSDNPEKKAEREEAAEPTESDKEKPRVPERETSGIDSEELKKYKERIAKEIKKDANVYEKMRQEVLPLIDKLEMELREIFVARKAKGWKGGFTSGKRIDIKRRIQEKAKSVPAMESKAWQKREMPDEKDYAISLLVDLSGSMARNKKIEETFKAVIVLSEVLNRLSINLEILGFNDRIYEYQNFKEQMSKLIREHMGGMLEEVHDSSDTGKAQWNDDGWALEQASERLARQKADQKFLVVMSDGTPEESPMHPRGKYELGKMIKKVLEETDIRLIGLGIGRGTEHVGTYYPNSIANVKVKEMAEKLAGLIKDVIANYDKF
ncbi:TPA: VWA domain-containing protein, partial [archaeon]|nr:VWA domain-containing protein [Candidatus Naiadarchaeales archaeon SRR2090153.bin461]